MCGLEIHQQLDTPKLFCSCPSRLEEEQRVEFLRRLRPTQSELGEVDRAALAEAGKHLSFRYLAGHHTCCLVEMDEEPPHSICAEAVEVGLQFALLTGMAPVDEVHVMRKLVIDGSNTTGFQRTSLIALGGGIDTPAGRVSLQTLCLEEDAARRVERKGDEVTFRLDRLGIPLLEVATGPDIREPSQARVVAEHLGMVMRSTGKARRGIGTIRQDLNVSVRGGARVELKGVQELEVIPLAVGKEAERQLKLLEVAGQLRQRGLPGKALEGAPVEDLTARFRGTEARLLRGALEGGGKVLGMRLPGFAGLLGTKEQGWPRLGAELGDHARVLGGVKGIFHSDELPGYGISAAEVEDVRRGLACQDGDAFVLVAASEEPARRALAAVKARSAQALDGVPEETREVQPDGTSTYLRPLPGRARMYPETDVPPFHLPPELVQRVRASLPELLPAREERMAREYGVGREELRVIVRAGDGPRFERLVAAAGREQDKQVARVLLQTLPEISQQVPDVHERLGEAQLADALAGLKEGAYAKEALPAVLREMALRGGRAREAAQRLGLGSLGEAQVRAAVRALLDKERALVESKGERALGALMGDAMRELRGKADGSLVSRVVKEELEGRLRGRA